MPYLVPPSARQAFQGPLQCSVLAGSLEIHRRRWCLPDVRAERASWNELERSLPVRSLSRLGACASSKTGVDVVRVDGSFPSFSDDESHIIYNPGFTGVAAMRRDGSHQQLLHKACSQSLHEWHALPVVVAGACTAGAYPVKVAGNACTRGGKRLVPVLAMCCMQCGCGGRQLAS